MSQDSIEAYENNSEEMLETSTPNVSDIKIEMKNSEDLFSEFGLSILFPENPNWIKDGEVYSNRRK